MVRLGQMRKPELIAEPCRVAEACEGLGQEVARAAERQWFSEDAELSLKLRRMSRRPWR